MYKKAIIICLLLSGCSLKKTYTCEKFVGENSIVVTIESNFDDIESINVRKSFILPYELILNEERYLDLCKQLDDTYHFEDNKLIQEYQIQLDKKYSLLKTLDNFKKEKYICERSDA